MEAEILIRKIEHIVEAAEGIRDEQRYMANTAMRVGGNLVNISEVLQDTFTNYLDQGVRIRDDVKFKSVTTNLIHSETFAPGETGTGFKFENDYGELTGLRLREYLYTPEIIKNKISVMADEFWFSASGVVNSVESVSGNLFRVTLKQENDIIEVPFRARDVLRGNFDTANGFDSVFFEVEQVDAGNVYLRSIYAGESEACLADPDGNLYVTENGDYLLVNVPGGPKRFMILARQGNTKDNKRQGSIYADGINKYIRVLDNITGKDIAFENIRVQMGDLNGLISPVIGRMSGLGLYGENVYLVGDFYLRNGKNVKNEIEGISVSLVEISTRVTEAEAAINLTVSKGEYDVFNKKISESVASISQRVSNAESVLNLTVSQTEFNSFSQVASESISSIIQRVTNTEASLKLTVSKTEYDAFSDSVTVSISSISQRVTNATAELDLTVKKDNIIASINASAETLNGSKLRLDADRIEINGNTIIRNKAGMQVDFFGAVGEVFNVNNGKFMVDIDGRMTAEDGTFRGSVDAISGTIGILEIQEGILKIKNPAGSSSVISECGIKPNCIKIYSSSPEAVTGSGTWYPGTVYGTILSEVINYTISRIAAGIVGIGGVEFGNEHNGTFGVIAIGGLKTDVISLGYSSIITGTSGDIPKNVSVVYFQLGMGDSGSKHFYIPSGVKIGHIYFFSNLDTSNPIIHAGDTAYELTNADSFLIVQHITNSQYRKIFYKK